MSNINTMGSAYQNQINLWNKTKATASANSTSSDMETKEATQNKDSKKDKVTLSPEVSLAKKREELGHMPTGKLTKKDFEAVVTSDEKAIEEVLQSVIESFELESKQVITFSRDSDGSIVINEEFDQREEIEELLNSDDVFVQKFNRLSANNEILNFSKKIQESSSKVSLLSILNNESNNSDSNSLFMIAERYKELKAGNNPFETLTNISRRETPFSMAFEVK